MLKRTLRTILCLRLSIAMPIGDPQDRFFCPTLTLMTDFYKPSAHSDFIWPFLRPYVGVIPNTKMALIFPSLCILAIIFPILIKKIPMWSKGSFLKSQIKSLAHVIWVSWQLQFYAKKFTNLNLWLTYLDLWLAYLDLILTLSSCGLSQLTIAIQC